MGSILSASSSAQRAHSSVDSGEASDLRMASTYARTSFASRQAFASRLVAHEDASQRARASELCFKLSLIQRTYIRQEEGDGDELVRELRKPRAEPYPFGFRGDLHEARFAETGLFLGALRGKLLVGHTTGAIHLRVEDGILPDHRNAVRIAWEVVMTEHNLTTAAGKFTAVQY